MWQKLLIQLRSMQMFYHNAHLHCGRTPFVGDHELLKDFYEAMDSGYDSVAERVIGTQDPMIVSLPAIQQGVAQKSQGLPGAEAKENSAYFSVGFNLEKELCSICSEIIKVGISEGTKQLLGDICNFSEMRQYKIKQRLKK